MADAEPLHDSRTPISVPPGESATDILPTRRTLLEPMAAIAFWLAIALPALYLPLFVTGLDSTGELLVFLGLFALHLLALVGGRSHRRY